MPDLTADRSAGDQPERPAVPAPAVIDDYPSEPRTAVVVRTAPSAVSRRWSRRAATAVARLPELARNPAVLATATLTATVAGEVAVGVLRRALGGGVGGPVSPPTGAMHISGVVVHRVHVVHHHVVHHHGVHGVSTGA